MRGWVDGVAREWMCWVLRCLDEWSGSEGGGCDPGLQECQDKWYPAPLLDSRCASRPVRGRGAVCCLPSCAVRCCDVV